MSEQFRNARLAMPIVKNDHRGCKVALERIFDYDDAKRPENCRSNACL